MTPGSAALLLAATWAGCLVGGPWPLAAVGLAVLLGASRRGVSSPVRLGLVLVGLVVTGAGLGGGRTALMDSGALARLAEDGGQAEVTATVVTDARATEFGAWTLVRVASLDGRGIRARALLRLPGVDGAPEVGERVVFRGTGRPLGDDGFEGHIRRLHAGVALTPLTAVRATSPAGPAWRMTNHVRARVRLATDWGLPTEEAALLTGLVTGDISGQSAERQEQFADAGLTHLVAVSGSNVALVLAGVLGLCAACGVGARGRRLTGVAAVCWFVLLVRAEPSVLRAALMAVLVLAAGLRGRGSDPLHVLTMAALLLLLADPFLSGQLGFALSVGATAGVLVLAPRVAARVPGPRPARVLVGATLGAQLGVAPILLTLPEGVGLWSVPANLVAVPAAAVASIVGVAAALLAQVSIAGGGVVAVLARPALRAVIWAAETFADGPRLSAGHLATPVAALLLAALLTRRPAPRLAAAALLLTVVVAALPHLRTAGPVAVVTLTALDVGQGDALLIETPAGAGRAGARMLVDGGPEPGAALAAVRARGVRGLDAVALTHAHADHAGGLPAVLATLPVGVLLVGPRPLEPDTAPPVAETYAMAARRDVAVLPVAAGAQFPLGDASVEVLSPPADGSLGSEPNDNSLVLRVAGSGATALLTGDAEIAAQERLLRDPAQLRADVLKVPHHGGDTNAPGFLRTVGARAAVLSVGAGNDYGHPDRDVLAELAGVAIYRTDRHGAVRVELRAGGPMVFAVARAPPRIPPVSGHRSPVLLFVGPEELLLRRAAERALEDLRNEGDLDVLDVRVADLREQGLPDLMTPSLFGTPRALLVRDAQELPPEVSAALVGLLGSDSPAATVLLMATGVGRIQTLAKRVKEAGGRIDVVPPREWEDRAWSDLVAEEFRLHGRSADRAAVAAVLAHAGLDVAAIAEKVAQAVATAAPGRVSADAVEAVVVGHGSRGTFAVADAMCDRNPERAVELLRGVLEAGDDPVLVLGALAYRMRSLVAVAGRLDLKAVGLNASPGQVRRLQGVRRNFGPGELTTAYRALADADREIKGGEFPPVFVLERAVVAVATRV